MNRKESNRLILDFMGVKPLSTGNFHSWSDVPFYYTTEDTFDKAMDNMSNYAKYDTSWDWIMKAVDKIDKLGFWTEIKGLASNSSQFVTAIGDYQAFPELDIWQVSESKIQSTYQAVVKFIQWHNNSQIKNI